ncbi:MAG: DUF3093 family protein, partial [Mycobacteriaceae bacterium]|nr:DUF3093 family protein [Mycobacteriaceae bacterium]
MPASPSWALVGIGRSRSRRTTARRVDTTAKTTLGRVSGGEERSDAANGSTTQAASPTVRYRERLSVPWWWWPPAFVPAMIIAPSVDMAARSLPVWIPFVILG